jgi:hypothetical protein
MGDRWRMDELTAQFRSLRAVTPSDTLDLPDGAARALIIGVGGTLSVIAVDDTDAVTLTVGPGLLPLRARRVRATGTTAASIVAGY